MSNEGSIFGTLNTKQKLSVLEDVAKDAAKKYKNYVAALKEALDFRYPTSTQRLHMYRNRVPEIWAALQGNMPALYNKQMQDWAVMEQRAEHRNISPWNPKQPSSDAPAYASPQSPFTE